MTTAMAQQAKLHNKNRRAILQDCRHEGSAHTSIRLPGDGAAGQPETRATEARALSGVDEDERGSGGGSGDHSRPGHGGGGELALEGAVPVVLDGIIGAAGEEARDGGLAVAEPRVGTDDGGVLLGHEGPALR